MRNDEPFLTLRQLADALGLPYFKLQRAAARGLFPTYRLLNSRKYGRKAEVLAVMQMHALERDAKPDDKVTPNGGSHVR